MRRKQGSLTPNEAKVLDYIRKNHNLGEDHSTFYGYEIASNIDSLGKQSLGHGTMYRILRRLEEFGYLTSKWATSPRDGSTPLRRYYTLAVRVGKVCTGTDLGSALCIHRGEGKECKKRKTGIYIPYQADGRCPYQEEVTL